MGTTNLFRVEVGTQTRKGHFNKLLDFVVKSNGNQNETYNHFLKKYKGFSISINKIEEIEVLELNETKTTNISKRIFNEDELKELRELKNHLNSLEKKALEKVKDNLLKDYDYIRKINDIGFKYNGYNLINLGYYINGELDKFYK